MKFLVLFVAVFLAFVAFGSATKEEPSSSSCTASKCKKLCYGRGYRRNVCLNGNCQCFDPDMQEGIDVIFPGSCTRESCKNLCYGRGFNNYECKHGNECQCEGSRNLAENERNSLLGSCTGPTCKAYCHGRGYRGYDCVEGNCQCGNFGMLEEKETKILPGPCTGKSCKKNCRKLGFLSWMCLGDQDCLCWISHQQENTVDEKLCMKKCRKHCQSEGAQAVQCINGHCICDE